MQKSKTFTFALTEDDYIWLKEYAKSRRVYAGQILRRWIKKAKESEKTKDMKNHTGGEKS